MPSAPTILQQLTDASWRGIKFPFSEREVGFLQEQAQHRFIFRDQQLIESIGRQNPTFRFRCPFFEGVRQQGWLNLFTSVYPSFFTACLDRSAGELVDPVHGTIRAKLASLSETLSGTRQDGVEVSADFIFAPEDTEETLPSQFYLIAGSLQGLQASAVVFGAAVNDLTDEQRKQIAAWNQDSTRGELNILQAGRAVLGSVQQYKDRTRAEIANATYQMEQARAELEQTVDPEFEPLRRDIGRMALAGKNLVAVESDRPFRKVHVSNNIGRLAFATSNQVQIEVLLAMNPWLVDLATIPAGSKVNLPRKDL
ncbi:MAG TPA: DNA circularization N-terminal domain-containing protein [Polyangiaceae bacterium]